MPKVKNIQTGEIQDVTDDQLGVTLASGEYEPEQGSRVAVVNEFGEIGTVDASEVMSGASDQSGMRIATPQEIAEQRKQQEYGEGLATLQAGAEGVARGATVGLSDALLTGLGVSSEGLLERQERNPIASGGGEAVGIVGSVLLSGGVGGTGQAAGRGALATAARMTPAGLLARGGMVAERELAQIVGKSVAGRALTAGALGVSEGAAYGAGEAVSEAALGDHELTAERLLASAGHGAIWGGAAGGLMSLAGSGIKAAAKKIKPKNFEQVDRELMQDFGLSVVKHVDVEAEIATKAQRASSVIDSIDATAEQKGFLRRQISRVQEFADGRRAVRQLDDTLDEQAENVTRWVTRAEEISDEVLYDDLTIASKIKSMATIAKNDAKVDVRSLANHIDESMQRTMDKYNEVVYDKNGFGYDPFEISTIKRVKKEYDTQLHRAKKLVREGDIHDNIEELLGLWDQSKRNLGKIDDALERNGFGRRPMGQDFKEYYMNTLREEMVDEALLGDAAKIQRAWNEAFTESIDVRRPYANYFLTDAGGKKKAGGFGNVRVGDYDKIQTAVKNAHRDINLRQSILRRSSEAQANLLDTLSSFNVKVNPKTLKLVQEARELSDNILKSMDTAADAASRADKYKRAIADAEDLPGAAKAIKTLAWAADRGEQVFSESFNGKLRGLYEEYFTSQNKRAAAIKGVNKRADSVMNTTRKAVDKFFTRGKRAAVPLVVTQRDKGDSLNARYKSTIERHDAILGNQGLIAERASQMLDAGITPNTSMALTSSALRAADFLKSKQPTPNTRPSDVFARLDKRQRAADSEIAKYLRYVEGVENPVESIKRFGESGDMPRETAEAIRTVYPKLFADLETKITKKLVDAKEPLPYGDLMRLSLILDRPLHPSLEGSYIAMCQSTHQQKRNDTVAPSRRSMPDTSEHYLSPSQRLG